LKKIWIFNHYVTPPTINSQNRHNIFGKFLKESGYDVSIFFSSQIHKSSRNLIKDDRPFRNESLNGITYIAIKTRSYEKNSKHRILNMIDFYLGLQKYVKLNKNLERPDIIYASSVHPLTLLAGIKIAKKLKVQCVCEVRDLWPLTLVEFGKLNERSIITKLLYVMEKYIYKKANKLIFTMSGGKKYIQDQGWAKQVDLNKIFHINNGIDLKEFHENKKKYKFNHEKFKNKNFKVIYAGSIGQANMVQTIVEAAKIIDLETENNIVFEIFGDGLERSKLEDYVKRENINNVNFYGKVKPEFIPSILSKSNINVIVGKNSDLYKYGFSQNKFFTYLASKKPIISDCEIHKILKETESGKIVEPEKPQSLAEGILEIYNMSEVEYLRYCDNAYELAKKYDFKILTNKLIKVFSE